MFCFVFVLSPSECDKMWQTGGHRKILLNHFTYVEHKVFKDKAVEVNVCIDAFALTHAR